MRKLLLAALLVCTACVTTTYNDQQLMAMTDDQLCAAVKADPMNIRTVTFMHGRKLECHPAMETCKAAGYKSGTKDYSDCVLANIEHLKNEQRARQEAARALFLSGGMNPQPVQTPVYQMRTPARTSCTGFGNTVNCTTY